MRTFLLILSVLLAACGDGVETIATGGVGGVPTTGGDGGTGGMVEADGTGGSGGVTATPIPDLPESWSDNYTCNNVVAIGPMLPDEAGAQSLVCIPTPDGGAVRRIRLYPAVGEQCEPMATDLVIFNAPLGAPPADPVAVRVIPIPTPVVPAGDSYARQNIDLGDEPFITEPGMVCLGPKLTAMGAASVCYVNGLNCGTSWLSMAASAPYAWQSVEHIPLIGLNVEDE